MTKLSPQARQKLASLRMMGDKVQRVHAMVERFATNKDPRQAEAFATPLKRELGRLKREFTGAGLDVLAQHTGAMELAAGRGGSASTKGRVLREGVGSLRAQIDQAQRKLITEEQRKQEAMERARRSND